MRTCAIALLTASAVITVGGAGVAQAQNASSREDGASDIIVTARRTDERLQDVPISITVFNQQQLDNRNVTTTADLAKYTPSLAANVRWGVEKATFSIRGFNQDAFTAPTVGVYFADVVGVRAQGGTASGNSVGVGAFMDLQNVQVLKGPQGTLFGRNTTGGAILLVPRKPTAELEGYVEGSIGNYDLRRVQGALNVPLADTFKVRLAIDRQTRDGYLRNRSGIGPGRYNNVDYLAGRLSIVADLTPDLENYIIAHFSDSDTAGSVNRLATCKDPLVGFEALTGYSACDQIGRQQARGDSLLDVDVYNPGAFVRLKQWQVINTTTWRASDTLTIKNIASYGEFTERSDISVFSDNFTVSSRTPNLGLPLTPGTPYQYISLNVLPGQYTAAESTFTEELQVQGKSADERLTYVLGGYLEFSRPTSWNNATAPVFLSCPDTNDYLQCTNPLFIGNVLTQRNRLSFDNHGVFAQGTFAFSDRLALTLGGRYTFDRIVADAEATKLNFAPFNGGPTTLVCNDTIRNKNPDGVSPKVVTDSAQCRQRLQTSSNRPTWLINLDYKPNQDILIYGKYARGYRQGGLSPIAIGAETWEPERLDSFEIGAKTTFRGAVRGYFNVAAFYNDFGNQQITAGLTPRTSDVAPSQTVLNIGKSTIKGIEVDASVTFFDDLQVDVGYSYLDTEVKEISVPQLDPGGPFAGFRTAVVEGDPLPLSPKNRVTVSATYTLPVSESLGRISFGATFTHTDEQRATTPDRLAPWFLVVMPATNLLDLNFNWRGILGSGFDASVFATNVTNRIYPADTGGGYSSGGGYGTWVMAPPRMYGARLRWNFGT